MSSSKLIQYSELTVKELKEICKEKGIKGYSNKKKDELISLITGDIKEIKDSTKKGKKISSEDSYSEEILQIRFYDFINSYKKTKEIGEKYSLPIRLPNMPEDISENIAKFIIKKQSTNIIKWSKAVGESGDLYDCDNNKTLEIKTFMSDGPISFGPKEYWDSIYFLDARNITNDKFILYYLNLSNTSTTWKNIKVNSVDTFEKQANEKRRPRNNWENIKLQLGDNIKKIFEGSFNDVFIVEKEEQ
jgi:hypothetical protein